MPKYFDVHLNFDSQSGRKQHNRGRKHQENVRGYYAQYAAALAQANREAAAAGMAPVTHGITLMPPSQTAGVASRPVAQPFAPYTPARDAGPPAGGAPAGPSGFSVRTIGPPMSHGGPPRPPFAGGPGGPPGAGGGGYAPPPHFQGALGMGPPGGYRGPPPPFQQQQQQGGPRGAMPPPPPFAQSNMPRPPAPFGGASYAPPNQSQPQQQQSQQPAGPPSTGASAPTPGAAKTFVNPDRMRALGLQDHR